MLKNVAKKVFGLTSVGKSTSEGVLVETTTTKQAFVDEKKVFVSMIQNGDISVDFNGGFIHETGSPQGEILMRLEENELFDSLFGSYVLYLYNEYDLISKRAEWIMDEEYYSKTLTNTPKMPAITRWDKVLDYVTTVKEKLDAKAIAYEENEIQQSVQRIRKKLSNDLLLRLSKEPTFLSHPSIQRSIKKYIERQNNNM